MRLKSLVWTALFCAAVGCGGTNSPPGTTTTPATFTQIYAAFFPRETKAQCNFCHSLPPNKISNGNLSMGTDKAIAYAALVGKSSASSVCAGQSLVVPGHPEESLFYLKFNETPPCGGRMPLGGDALSTEQREMVRSWIAAGALDD